MGLILSLLAAAFAAMKALDAMASQEPLLATGVTTQVKASVIQALVSGIGSTICALLGIRSRQSTMGLRTGRRLGSYVEDDE